MGGCELDNSKLVFGEMFKGHLDLEEKRFTGKDNGLRSHYQVDGN